jgi:hypothetical protein
VIIENPDIATRDKGVQIPKSNPVQGIGVDSQVKIRGAVEMNSIKEAREQSEQQEDDDGRIELKILHGVIIQ